MKVKSLKKTIFLLITSFILTFSLNTFAIDEQPIHTSAEPVTITPAAVEPTHNAPTQPAPTVVAPTSKPLDTSTIVPMSQLTELAEKTLLTLFNYDYQSYTAQIDKAKALFTKSGWDAFQSALTESNNIRDVVANKMSVACQLNAPSTLVSQNATPNGQEWVIETPITVDYKTSTKSMTQKMLAHTTIVAAKDSTSASNLGVQTIVVKPIP